MPSTRHALYQHLARLAGDANAFAALALETTGFDLEYGEIVEIGIVKLDTAGQLIEEYQTLIQPDYQVYGSEVHGLTDQHVEEAPCLAEASGDLVELLDGACVVYHSHEFDLRLLGKTFRNLGGRFDPGNSLDIVKVRQHAGKDNASLEALCDLYGVVCDSSLRHMALYDARVTAEVFLRGAAILEPLGQRPCIAHTPAMETAWGLARNVRLPRFEPRLTEAERCWDLASDFRQQNTAPGASEQGLGAIDLIPTSEAARQPFQNSIDLPVGSSVVLTGNHPMYPRLIRQQITEILESRGFRVASSVSANTAVLLVGDSPGKRKRKDAAKHGIPQLPIADFNGLTQTDSRTEPDRWYAGNVSGDSSRNARREDLEAELQECIAYHPDSKVLPDRYYQLRWELAELETEIHSERTASGR